VAFTDETIVTVYKESSPKLDPFAEVVKADRKMTYGELKSFVSKNQSILTERMVKRYYRSFTGYTPTFNVSGSAEIKKTIVYKDGTKEDQTDSARIYIGLFENQVGGKGMAYSSSGFSYRAYAYHPDYKSGISKGLTVRQYLNLADMEMVLLLSKDTPPVAIDGQKTVMYGRLMAAGGKPLANARVTSEKANLTVRSDGEGYFSLSLNDLGDYAFKIIPPETANAVTGSATINGGALKDTINITVSNTPSVYRVDWYEKGYDLKTIRVSNQSAKGGINPFVIGLAVVLILVLAVVIILGGKKKRRTQPVMTAYPQVNPMPYAPVPPGHQGYAPMAPQNQQYIPQAPMMPPVPSQPAEPFVTPTDLMACGLCGTGLSGQERFCPGCGALVCTNCRTTSQPGTRFCRNCGKPF
jgi:hypothetical protein